MLHFYLSFLRVSIAKRFVHGARTFLRGVRLTHANPDVRAAYRWIIAALFVFCLALNAIGLGALWHYTPLSSDTSWMSLAMVWALRIVGGVLVLLVAPLLSITLCNLLFPAFSEIPFTAGVRALSPKLAAQWESQPGLPVATAIAITGRRLVFMLLVLAGCFLLALIPIVGPFIASPIQVYLGARTTGWEMLDPYFDRHGVSWKAQKSRIQEVLPEVLGMGAVCAPILAVPFIGPLCFGFLQAGAAHFALEIMEAHQNDAAPALQLP